MGWTVVFQEKPAPTKHQCAYPHWGEVPRAYKNGSLWQCEMCGQTWELKWEYGHGEDEGMPMGTFIRI